MYYICKFSGTWSIYNCTNGKSQILAEDDIALLKEMFPAALSGNSILDAIMIAPVAAAKLQNSKKPPQTGSKGSYYILRLGGTWLIDQGVNYRERVLEKKEIELFAAFFPSSLQTDSRLDTLFISPIPATKLQQIPTGAPSAVEAPKSSAAPIKSQ